MNPIVYILLAFALVIIALFLLRGGSQRQRDAGLPRGRVVYDDSSRHGGESVPPLYSAVLGLSGKPDYIVRQGGAEIPVEVKSRRAPHEPYDSHIYQMAAYCMLVAEHFGKRPPYGIIRYQDRAFQIPFTRELEQSLVELLGEMRHHKVSVIPHRSHGQPARCAGCGYQAICEERLK